MGGKQGERGEGFLEGAVAASTRIGMQLEAALCLCSPALAAHRYAGVEHRNVLVGWRLVLIFLLLFLILGGTEKKGNWLAVLLRPLQVTQKVNSLAPFKCSVSYSVLSPSVPITRDLSCIDR